MGTRNLTMVVLDGQYRVAQYCQWDGYPEGQGATVLAFAKKLIRFPKVRNQFIKNLQKTTFISDEHLELLWKSFGAEGQFVSMEIAEKLKSKHPQFSRDTGAKILELIKNGGIEKLKNDLDFAADSLFCEWAYVIDLDNDKLEVYGGFNTENPLTKNDRFFFLTEKAKKETKKSNFSGNEYYPIRLIKSYSLENLPTIKQMDKECNPLDEEEE